MKKLSSLYFTAVTYLLGAPTIYAQTPTNNNLPIKIENKSGQGIDPQTDPGKVIGNAIAIIFIVGVLAMLLMLVIGAFNWITSGGDKENVAKARSRIVNALIGLLLLAVTFLIARIAGQVVRIDVFNLNVPSLDK